jgi:hypothetical protein
MVLLSAQGMDVAQIRRYIAWRNRYAHDRRLGEIVNRATVARRGDLTEAPPF